MRCGVCGTVIPFTDILCLKFGKAKDGCICKYCKEKTVKIIPFNTLSLYDVKQLIIYNLSLNEELNRKPFNATSELGMLKLDEINRYLKVVESRHKEMTVRMEDITDLALDLSKPVVKGRNISGDIIFSMRLNNGLNITKRIKTGVRIDYSITGNKIQYNEPGELIVMKCLISQVYENMSSELKKNIYEYNACKDIENDSFTTQGSIERIKALSLFGLDDKYTGDELKSRYRLLMKMFHPDSQTINNSILIDYTERINAAYELLKNNL